MTKSAINEGSKTYAGLDVSPKETAICIVNDNGKIVSEQHGADRSASDRQVPPQAWASPRALRARERRHIGLALARVRQSGLPVICLDSRHAHRVLSMKRNKNDRNDARGLADLVRIGWYREARARSIDAQFVRSMLLSRQQLLRSRRSIENQIRGALKTLGVMTGPTKGRGFMPRVVELRADTEWLGPVLDPLIAAHASIEKQLKVVSANVLNAAREDADVRRMMTVPGIGAMTALAFKAAIDDPKRFTTSTKVGPYLGLTPRTISVRRERMDRQHRQDQRSAAPQLLYEAAGVLMTRVRRSCPLKVWALGSPSASAGSAPRSPWRANLPSSCTPSGATAPNSSGKRRRRSEPERPRQSFRASGRRPCRDDGQIDLVAIVAGPGRTARVTQ